MKVQNMVPEVYYKESRDFSYIGRLFEILFNHLKTNADLVNSSLVNIDSDDLLNSLSYTLGFKPKHTYNNKDLFYICSSFVDIMKNKGSYYAIEECIKILLNSQYITGQFIVIPDNDKFEITIGLPPGTQDIILLEDLLDYILPTGWIYRITTLGKLTDLAVDTYVYSDGDLLKDDINKAIVVRNSQSLSQVTKPQVVENQKENKYEYDNNSNDYDKFNAISNEKSQSYSGVVFKPTEINEEEEGD